MKRLVILIIVLFIGIPVLQAQRYDTVSVLENGKIVKKAIPKEEIILSEIQFQEGIDPSIFSKEEIEKLANGEKLEKTELLESYVLVKIFPIVETKDSKITSIFKEENGVIRKIDEKPITSPPRKSYPLSILWIYIPLVLVFLVAYLNTKNERKGFIIFSLATITAIFVAIIVGFFARMFAGALAGAIAGAFVGVFAGAIAGAFAGIAGAFAGEFAGGLTRVFAGALAGVFAGAIAGSSKGGVIWQYMLIYISICALAFIFREIVTVSQNVKREPEQSR